MQVVTKALDENTLGSWDGLESRIAVIQAEECVGSSVNDQSGERKLGQACCSVARGEAGKQLTSRPRSLDTVIPKAGGTVNQPFFVIGKEIWISSDGPIAGQVLHAGRFTGIRCWGQEHLHGFGRRLR